MGFLLEQAQPADMDEIMRIEDASFAPEIRESRAVFVDRRETFPEGNLVLFYPQTGIPGKSLSVSGSRALAGYFSSEIWGTVPPAEPQAWALGHSARERQIPDGKVLYISSFAVEPASRSSALKDAGGYGAGAFLFNTAIERITGNFPRLDKIAFIVHEDWIAARRIYEKAGFRYSGRIETFFFPYGKALIMEKDI
jgi:ribosomal-protein-alanine N-acetyltransferase